MLNLSLPDAVFWAAVVLGTAWAFKTWADHG